MATKLNAQVTKSDRLVGVRWIRAYSWGKPDGWVLIIGVGFKDFRIDYQPKRK